MNDIVINKIQSIQRCITRARAEYNADPDSFAQNFTRQDAAVMNVLRACEQSIDLANHLIKTHKMGIPTTSSESFGLLAEKGVIDNDLRQKLTSMVHFRNTIVHQYQDMDIAIVQIVIESGLDDLIRLGDDIMAWLSK